MLARTKYAETGLNFVGAASNSSGTDNITDGSVVFTEPVLFSKKMLACDEIAQSARRRQPINVSNVRRALVAESTRERPQMIWPAN
jgi:hypothetical protein